jgi:SAM-dependent methyltransferase
VPTVEENLAAWNDGYDWVLEGDEWSAGWGGAEAQWFGCLFPRLRRLLPAATVLEIAPGHGRWTDFLARHCDRLIGVDLSSSCVDVCRERFAGRPNLEFFVNDGRSLDMVDDGTVDLVFSFDSLVHVELDVLRSYLEQIARKLAPGGSAFLHHSNAGEYQDEFDGFDRLGVDEVADLEASGERPPRHWRAMSVTAALVREVAADVGLRCVSQEIINWGGQLLIDCISVVTLPASESVAEPRVRRNRDFTAEMRSVRATAAVYGDWSEKQRRRPTPRTSSPNDETPAVAGVSLQSG